MSPFRMIFVHGYTSSRTQDWYPAVTQTLKAKQIDFVIPDFPGGSFPHASEWLALLQQVVSRSKKPIMLVGHSLGTRAILLFLEKYQHSVESVFLIAPFANTVENAHLCEDESYPDFFEHTVDLVTVVPLAKQWHVLHSTDDPSIPYEQGVELANDLGAVLHTVAHHGHFTDLSDANVIVTLLQSCLRF